MLGHGEMCRGLIPVSTRRLARRFGMGYEAVGLHNVEGLKRWDVWIGQRLRPASSNTAPNTQGRSHDRPFSMS